MNRAELGFRLILYNSICNHLEVNMLTRMAFIFCFIKVFNKLNI